MIVVFHFVFWSIGIHPTLLVFVKVFVRMFVRMV
jgi:hypothetical protein